MRGGYIASLKGSFHRCDARCRKRRLREPEKPKHPRCRYQKSAARRQVVRNFGIWSGNQRRCCGALGLPNAPYRSILLVFAGMASNQLRRRLHRWLELRLELEQKYHIAANVGHHIQNSS